MALESLYPSNKIVQIMASPYKNSVFFLFQFIRLIYRLKNRIEFSHTFNDPSLLLWYKHDADIYWQACSRSYLTPNLAIQNNLRIQHPVFRGANIEFEQKNVIIF